MNINPRLTTEKGSGRAGREWLGLTSEQPHEGEERIHDVQMPLRVRDGYGVEALEIRCRKLLAESPVAEVENLPGHTHEREVVGNGQPIHQHHNAQGHARSVREIN